MNTHRVFLSASLAAAVMALSLGASACGGGGSSASGGSLSSGVVASVAGDEITQAELDEVISQAKDRLESQGQKIPAAGSQEYQAFQQNALAYLVQRTQFEQKAEELDVTVTDKEVDERVARVLTQFFGGNRKKYEEALEKQGITDAQVRDELRATLVSEKIFEKVGDSAKVTDAEIKAYYNAHPELYTQQASRRVRHILVKSKALADDIHGQLADGADFAALAKKHSTRLLEGRRRRADDPQGRDGSAVREGRARAQGQRDLAAGQDPVRLAHHRGPRAAQRPEAHPAGEREADDPRHARRPEALRRRHEVARRPQAGVRGQDRVRLRLRTPGHVARRGYDRDRLSLEQALGELQELTALLRRECPWDADQTAAHDRPPHRGGGVRGRGCRDGGRRREARRRAR